MRTTFLVLLFPFFASAQIVNIEDRRTAFSDSIGWFENLDIGLDLIKNDESVLSISGAFQVEVLQKKRMILSISKFKFLDAGDQKFVNEGFQHLRFNRIVNHWLTVELFGQVQYNEQIFVKLRALAGSGLRYRLVDRKDRRMYLGTTYMYEYDEESKSGITHRDHRLSTYLSFNWKIQNNLTLSSTTYYQPLFAQWSDYRLSTESTLSINLSKHIAFRSTFQLSYDSRTPVDAPPTSYSLENGVQYKF